MKLEPCYQTLIFQESPFIGCVSGLIIILTYKTKFFVFAVTIFICILLFYRYKEHANNYDNNILISPAEGTIIHMEQKGNYVHISIYMNFLNNHTQIYPINGVVIDRIYDNTGKFNLVNKGNKSRFNEKKIHKIMSNYGLVHVTQIAGFFPRRISSSTKIPEIVAAGDYLGMIKFGSRIDISFIGSVKNIKHKKKKINIGDVLYKY